MTALVLGDVQSQQVLADECIPERRELLLARGLDRGPDMIGGDGVFGESADRVGEGPVFLGQPEPELVRVLGHVAALQPSRSARSATVHGPSLSMVVTSCQPASSEMARPDREHLAGDRAVRVGETGDQRGDVGGANASNSPSGTSLGEQRAHARGGQGEPGAGDRGDRVDAHAVALELVRGDQGQRGDAGLGGAVVGLAGVGHERARRRRGVDHRTRSPARRP